MLVGIDRPSPAQTGLLLAGAWLLPTWVVLGDDHPIAVAVLFALLALAIALQVVRALFAPAMVLSWRFGALDVTTALGRQTAGDDYRRFIPLLQAVPDGSGAVDGLPPAHYYREWFLL